VGVVSIELDRPYSPILRSLESTERMRLTPGAREKIREKKKREVKKKKRG